MQNLSSADTQTIITLLNTAASWVLGYPLRVTGISKNQIGDQVLQAAKMPGFEGKIPQVAGGVGLADIAQKISLCTRCSLHKGRKNTVSGTGAALPLVMVIGEAPGADEDASGLPFVGLAGQLLDKMLEAIQLSRNTNCFIGNIVKCRPPHNRDPMPEESAACSSFLQAQIHVLKPKMILVVGRLAAQSLLKSSEGIGKLRGRFFTYDNIPLMPTYHPSALLRDPLLKKPAWEDLKLFRSRLLELAPDYAMQI